MAEEKLSMKALCKDTQSSLSAPSEKYKHVNSKHTAAWKPMRHWDVGVGMVIINRGPDFWWLWQAGTVLTVKKNQEVGVGYVGSDNTPYLLFQAAKGD